MKSKLEFFSPTNEGQLVTEAIYLKQMLEFAQSEWRGITFTEVMIRKLWGQVKKGDYPEDSVADEVAECYEKMAYDWDAANELVESAEEPVIVNENPEPQQTDDSLALVQSVNDGLELSSFTKMFDLGEGMTQCIPRGDATPKDWVRAFAFGLTLESGSQWIIGDSVVALENAGHSDVVTQLCAQFKKSYSTVSGYARTARDFQPFDRDPMLPFTVYREVSNADLPEKKKFDLIDAAKTEKLSSQEVRGKVREAQGKEDKMKPLPHRYLVLNVANFANSEVVKSVPKKLEPHHLVIDLQGKSWLDAGNNEWLRFLVSND